MVERSLSMREVPGSMPGSSSYCGLQRRLTAQELMSEIKLCPNRINFVRFNSARKKVAGITV